MTLVAIASGGGRVSVSGRRGAAGGQLVVPLRRHVAMTAVIHLSFDVSDRSR